MLVLMLHWFSKHLVELKEKNKLLIKSHFMTYNIRALFLIIPFIFCFFPTFLFHFWISRPDPLITVSKAVTIFLKWCEIHWQPFLLLSLFLFLSLSLSRSLALFLTLSFYYLDLNLSWHLVSFWSSSRSKFCLLISSHFLHQVILFHLSLLNAIVTWFHFKAPHHWMSTLIWLNMQGE